VDGQVHDVVERAEGRLFQHVAYPLIQRPHTLERAVQVQVRTVDKRKRLHLVSDTLLTQPEPRSIVRA